MQATILKIAMPILMDTILTEYANQAFEASRLRRNGVNTTPDLVSAEMLVDLEASGDAMRFVDADGRIAWKATPRLCDHLRDLERDAQDELEDF
jgi:hypothetical protein